MLPMKLVSMKIVKVKIKNAETLAEEGDRLVQPVVDLLLSRYILLQKKGMQTN